MSSRIALVLGALALVLPLAACGAGSKPARTASSHPASTSTVPPTSPASTSTTGISPTNGSSSAVLPANFIVNADGSMSPPLVAGPGATTIVMTVTSHAPHPVNVSVDSRSLAVAPGAHASVRLQGLKTAVYPIEVDGHKRATLVIGAQPGP